MQRTPRRPDPRQADYAAIEFASLHARDLQRELQHAPDHARLRARQHGSQVQIVLQPHKDALIRRVFSRAQIDEERRLLRRCLKQVGANLTPERRQRFSAAGKNAAARLERLASLAPRHEIRAAQVRSPLSLLAGSRTGQHPVARQALPPAPPATPRRHVTMQNLQFDQKRERRLHLYAFRNALSDDAGAKQALEQAMFGDCALSNAHYCLLVFRAATSLYQEWEYGGADGDSLFARLHASTNGKLLELFLLSWRAAWGVGKIRQCGFSWADTVDWLVCGLEKAAAESAGRDGMARMARRASPRAAEPGLQSAAPQLRPRHSGTAPATLRSAPARVSSGRDFMPGRQAQAVVVANSPGGSPATPPQTRQLQPSSRRAPPSPVSPSAPLFPKLLAYQHGRLVGIEPGLRKTRSDADAAAAASGSAARLQRSASMPYGSRTLKNPSVPSVSGATAYQPPDQ